MPKPSKKQPDFSDIVKPIIRVNGEKHILESIFEGPLEDLPELKSVGYAPVKSGSHSWVSYVITTKGKEVINIEVSEPDLKAIAEESAKISFVNHFIDQEF